MNNQTLRIIAGDWRGRKIKFESHNGLRPTADRIRETLFNWLSPYIAGADCLDLFAGSGALSFEALSRGANSASLVEDNRKICEILKTQIKILNTKKAEVFSEQAETFIPKQLNNKHYDIIFLDPPYSMNAFDTLAPALDQSLPKGKRVFIYFEDNKPLAENAWPQAWEKLKSKKAGKVHFYLFCKH